MSLGHHLDSHGTREQAQAETEKDKKKAQIKNFTKKKFWKNCTEECLSVFLLQKTEFYLYNHRFKLLRLTRYDRRSICGKDDFIYTRPRLI